MAALPKDVPRPLPSIEEFDAASRGYMGRTNSNSKKCVETGDTLERVLGPARSKVSIGFWPRRMQEVEQNPRRAKMPKGAVVFDYPTQIGAWIQPEQIAELWISHHHPDHIGPESAYPEKKTHPEFFKFQTHMYWQTKLLLDYLDRPVPFENIVYFQEFEEIVLPGVGTMIPIPFSHCLGMFGFWLATEAGRTIVNVPEHGEGDRTNRALDYLREKAGSDGIDFLIADATNMGRETRSLKEHIDLVKADLFITEKVWPSSKVAAVYLSAGDCGLILKWLNEKLLDNFHPDDIFFAPRLAKFLTDDLHWDKEYGEKFRLHIQALENPREQIRQGHPTLVFYDRPSQNPLEGLRGIKQYNLIDASHKGLQYRPKHAVGIYPVGMSGHSPNAVRELVGVTKPQHQAVSHPPLIGKNLGYLNYQRKLTRRGLPWEL